MKVSGLVFFLLLMSCNNSSGEGAVVESETTLRKYMRDMRYSVNSLSCRIIKQTDRGDSVCDGRFRYCEVNYTDSSNLTRNSNFCCDTITPYYNNGCYELRN